MMQWNCLLMFSRLFCWNHRFWLFQDVLHAIINVVCEDACQFFLSRNNLKAVESKASFRILFAVTKVIEAKLVANASKWYQSWQWINELRRNLSSCLHYVTLLVFDLIPPVQNSMGNLLSLFTYDLLFLVRPTNLNLWLISRVNSLQYFFSMGSRVVITVVFLIELLQLSNVNLGKLQSISGLQYLKYALLL